MALDAVRSWFGRPAKLPVAQQIDEPSLARVVPLAALAPNAPKWPRERLGTTDALWGEGYQFPGGEIETLRLAKPLGLSAASSLLLLGAGGGGPSCSRATKLGVWVSGF